MTFPGPYQYKKPGPSIAVRRLDRVRAPVEDENFVGEIQGMPSSDIEERFARSLDKAQMLYEFRAAYVAGRNLQGSVELDFAVYQANLTYPIQIDGAFAHKTAAQKDEDSAKDAILDDRLRGSGAFPVRRIPGDKLDTQEMSDAVVEELFGV